MEAAIDLIGMGTFASSCLSSSGELGSARHRFLPSCCVLVWNRPLTVALLSVLPNAGRRTTITGPYRSSSLPAGQLLSHRI